MKRLLLILVLFLACGTVSVDSPTRSCGKAVVPELPPSDDPLEVIILGDKYGIPTPGKFDQVYAAAVAEAPDLMVSIGDILDSAGLLSYSPVLYTTGNHDDDEILALGLPLYSDVIIDGIHFILIDNGTTLEIDSVQMEWLAGALTVPARWTLVFCHRMFWNYDMVDNQINHELHNLFLASGVDAVFAGHHHRWFPAEYDGIEYINVGRTAGFDTRTAPSFDYKDTTYVLPEVEPYGYVKVTIGESMQITFVEVQ